MVGPFVLFMDINGGYKIDLYILHYLCNTAFNAILSNILYFRSALKQRNGLICWDGMRQCLFHLLSVICIQPYNRLYFLGRSITDCPDLLFVAPVSLGTGRVVFPVFIE